MTTGQDRRNWDADQQYRHHLEMQEKRDAWFAQKKHEREQAERQQKQAALESHLAERARTFFDHTGTTPSPSLLGSWQEQYVDQQELARQAEREAKLAKSTEQNYRF